MKNKYPVRGKTAYRVGLVLRAESAILGSGRVDLGALEKHLPSIFVHCVIELSQRLVLGRFELPQVEYLLLALENPVEEHDLDYDDEFNLLVD